MSQRVTVSTRVAADPAEAFARFTGEIGAWWAAGAVAGARWNGVLRLWGHCWTERLALAKTCAERER